MISNFIPNFITLFFSVSPAQEWGRRSYNDPFQDFDNSFQPEFDEMEEDERIHNELEVNNY